MTRRHVRRTEPDAGDDTVATGPSSGDPGVVTGDHEAPVDPVELAASLFDRTGPLVTLYVDRVRPVEVRGYCGTLHVDSSTAPELVERIRQAWGGGEYRIRVTRDGRYMKGASGMVVIAGSPARATSAMPTSPIVVQAPAPSTSSTSSSLGDVLATARALTELAQRSASPSTDPELVRELATLRAQLATVQGAAASSHDVAPELGAMARQLRQLRTLAGELGLVDQRTANPGPDEGVGGVKMPRDPMELATMFGMFWMLREMSKPQMVPVQKPDGTVGYQMAPPDPAQAQMMAAMLGMPMGSPMMGSPMMGSPMMGSPMGAPPMGAPTMRTPNPAPPPSSSSSSPPPSSPSSTSSTSDDELDDDDGELEPLTPDELAAEIAAVPEDQQLAYVGEVLARLPPSLLMRMQQAAQQPPPPLKVATGGSHE